MTTSCASLKKKSKFASQRKNEEINKHSQQCTVGDTNAASSNVSNPVITKEDKHSAQKSGEEYSVIIMNKINPEDMPTTEDNEDDPAALLKDDGCGLRPEYIEIIDDNEDDLIENKAHNDQSK